MRRYDALLPTWTQVPNIFFEDLLAHLTHGELLCALYIIRHTSGFHRRTVPLSFNEFSTGRKRRDGTTYDNGTGLDRRSVIRCLDNLEELGLIRRKRRMNENGTSDKTVYSLRISWSDEVSESEAPGVTESH